MLGTSWLSKMYKEEILGLFRGKVLCKTLTEDTINGEDTKGTIQSSSSC